MQIIHNMDNIITLEKACECCDSEKYIFPQIFNDDCGLDIITTNFNGDELIAKPSWGYTPNNKVRRVTLEITTFKGISFNAIHYYGKMVVQGVNMEYVNNSGVSTMIFNDNLPLAHYTYDLKLKRPLCKGECETDRQRWGGYYDEGDMIPNFNTIEELISLAKQIFEIRFVGEWELVICLPNGKCVEKILKTK